MHAILPVRIVRQLGVSFVLFVGKLAGAVAALSTWIIPMIAASDEMMKSYSNARFMASIYICNHRRVSASNHGNSGFLLTVDVNFCNGRIKNRLAKIKSNLMMKNAPTLIKVNH